MRWGRSRLRLARPRLEGWLHHIPGHLPSVLLSMTKVGHYTEASQLLFIVGIVALSRALLMPLHGRVAAALRLKDERRTYRPRSASSLLIRLRAILIRLGVCEIGLLLRHRHSRVQRIEDGLGGEEAATNGQTWRILKRNAT